MYNPDLAYNVPMEVRLLSGKDVMAKMRTYIDISESAGMCCWGILSSVPYVSIDSRYELTHVNPWRIEDSLALASLRVVVEPSKSNGSVEED